MKRTRGIFFTIGNGAPAADVVCTDDGLAHGLDARLHLEFPELAEATSASVSFAFLFFSIPP